MADVLSLFGLTPEGLSQQRYQQDLKQGYELAQLDPGAAARATLQSGVGQLGRGIAGMMGVEDPQMKLISARQSIIGQLDQTDPASLLRGAKSLSDMGDQQGAFALADYARKAQSERALAQQRMAEKMTPEQRNAMAFASSVAEPGTPQFNQVYQKTLSEQISKEKPEATSAEMKNARALALLEGPEGSPAYNAKYSSELARMTSKEKPEAKPNIQKLQEYAATLPPGSPLLAQVQAVIKAESLGRGVTLNMPPQEKEEKSARGKMLVKQYEGVSDQARIALRTLPSLESNLSILDKGFDTGFGTEVVAAGAKVLGALGVPEAERLATNAQTFLANANAAVLQRQLEQKGPQTESDAQRITTTGAQFGNTKEANRFLISVAKAQLKRDVDQRNFYDKWWKANSTYDGAEDAWFSGEGGRSLFDRPELKAYKVKESAASQIPSQSAVSTNIPQDAINALKRGVGTDAQFDEMFGQGAAKRVRGNK